ncbi:MAG: phosphate regulon transcriptional regulator PhoB [Proteobacteria bacterium]|nr:phosphate regulon transcriptional regulator PhoB [Pseudomonadota bacterium]MCL2308240.1 phosphate regulon transcriptional regulator PhoB [Pseudomonadota bacterium]
MTTILIVEDEPAIAELLRVTLEAERYTVRDAGSAEAAWQIIEEASPDLLLLDWMLPGQSGLALAKRLRQQTRTKTLPIIMVTARAEEADKVAGLETWVDDYITKPFSPRELKARVKALLRRRTPEDSDTPLQAGMLILDPVSHRVHCDGKSLTLGPLEFRLLHFLMARPERVFARAQLLDAVWGDEADVEERTVDVLVRRLRQALATCRLDVMLETVRGTGYRWNPEKQNDIAATS